MTVACVCEPLVKHGHRYVPWLSHIAGTCVYTAADVAALALGALNMLCFVVAQIPQLYENYKTANVAGLSVLFLVGWLLADCMALAGCVLTSQRPYMVVTSIFFVSSDVLLLLQVGYYSCAPVRRSQSSDKSVPLLGENGSVVPRESWSLRRIAAAAFLALAAVAAGAFVVANLSASAEPPPEEAPDCNADPATTNAYVEFIGALLSWVANGIYIAARVPQIVLNWRRKSCEGLSALMFICSIGGNLSYSVSILMQLKLYSVHFWTDTSPYLISCLITVAADAIILYQARIYRVDASEPDPGR